VTSSASRQVVEAAVVGAVAGAVVGVAFRDPVGALVGYDVAILL
jgi:outer membrane lipoprotein SlyB